jgi:hypothetical protein
MGPGYEELVMTMINKLTALAAFLAAIAIGGHAAAQTARDIEGPTWLVPIPNEPPPKLIVDPPIPEQLALGKVFIQYRTENLRILPVSGAAALNVSPRVGHMHIFVDDASWPIVDAHGDPFVAVGLKPGPHKVVFQLADAVHRPFPGAIQTVTFVVPDVSVGQAR